MSYLNLFLVFVKIGAILLGGGYVILPILMNEFVEKRDLVTQDELIDYFALSQSLPGIIAANISMFIGYKLKGKFGAVVAMLGIIFVPFICIVSLASVLGLLSENSYIQSAFWGVGVAVVALIMLTIREILQKSTKDYFFYFIFSISLISLLILEFSPIKTILIYTFGGVLYKYLTEKRVV